MYGLTTVALTRRVAPSFLKRSIRCIVGMLTLENVMCTYLMCLGSIQSPAVFGTNYGRVLDLLADGHCKNFWPRE